MKTIAGRTPEEWKEYARHALELKRKAVSEAQEIIKQERACLS